MALGHLARVHLELRHLLADGGVAAGLTDGAPTLADGRSVQRLELALRVVQVRHFHVVLDPFDGGTVQGHAFPPLGDEEGVGGLADVSLLERSCEGGPAELQVGVDQSPDEGARDDDGRCPVALRSLVVVDQDFELAVFIGAVSPLLDGKFPQFDSSVTA